MEEKEKELRPGDTCHCQHVVDGLPLTLFSLVRDGKLMGNYACGREHGVSFSRKQG